jgi:hypothetical protein
MASTPLPPSLLRRLSLRGWNLSAVTPLPGDVSRRRYYRVRRPKGGSAILAVYPEDLRPVCRRFLATGRLLTAAGVPVPEVLDAECEASGEAEGLGWMLLEDAGGATLFDLFAGRRDPWAELEPYYRRAAELAGRIAALPAPAAAALNPPLDGGLLRRELEQTWEAFFEPRGLARSRGLGARLAKTLEALCETLAAEPLAPCHRDFMVRNLVPRPDPRPGRLPEVVVLDHQDLRLGPRGYDLASLFDDSLFPPRPWVDRLLTELASDAAGEPGSAPRLGYHRAAAQRTLKAVGTFARHGAPRHRALIAPTFERALEHLSRLPEAAALSRGGQTAGLRALAAFPRGDLVD